MKAAMLHLVTAAASFAGAQVWLVLGDTMPALSWMALSIAWLAFAVSRLGSADAMAQPQPASVTQTQRLERILSVSNRDR
jgi:hypothetical protein